MLCYSSAVAAVDRMLFLLLGFAIDLFCCLSLSSCLQPFALVAVNLLSRVVLLDGFFIALERALHLRTLFFEISLVCLYILWFCLMIFYHLPKKKEQRNMKNIMVNGGLFEYCICQSYILGFCHLFYHLCGSQFLLLLALKFFTSQ